jgi:List-Bact-rpt repeat protein
VARLSRCGSGYQGHPKTTFVEEAASKIHPMCSPRGEALLLRSFLSLLFTLAIVSFVSCGGGTKAVSPPPAGQIYQLSVTRPVSGTGSVTSTPPGINCPTTCSGTFPQGTQVKLSAAPANNYFFDGWSGACSGTAACTVSMTGSEKVGATFDPGEVLTVSIAGSGAGTVTSSPAGINCPTTCSFTFPPNTQVTFSETPGSNDAFTSWAGACSGSANCSLTLDASMSITANFSSENGSGSSQSTTFVYVASSKSANNNQVVAYRADSTGQLSPVTGSPFAVNAAFMTASGKYLFTTDGTTIYSYSVASDGSITQSSSINANQSNPKHCGSPISLFTDRTGSTVYDLDYVSDCANNQYGAFSVGSSSGALTFNALSSAASPVFNKPLSFLANDRYGYSASCWHYIQEIYGFKRNSDGSLTLVSNLGSAPPMPTPPPGDTYCPWLAAADTSNHVAITLSAMNAYTFQADGPTQIAVYSADSAGNLSTNSTAADMPAVAVGNVGDIQMSPAGNYLAVAGTGVQVFNFNGANSVTPLTGLLTNTPIDQIAWDQNNHLYAISKSAGQLLVFTVTSAGTSQAPGSPYNLTAPLNVAIWQSQ